MFIWRAVVLQLFFLVAMEAEPISQPDAQVSTLCSDWKQAICQMCGSVDLEDRCCWEEATYRRCIDGLLDQYQSPAADRSGAESWALGGQSATPVSDKRAKYFLGKRVKYFLGKRGGRGRQLEADSYLDVENERPFRLGVEAGKRAKYFLGK